MKTTHTRRQSLAAVLALSALPVLGALFALLPVPASAQDAKPSASAPVFQVGESWKYQFQDIGNKREPSTFVNSIDKIEGNDVWMHVDNATRKSWILIDGGSSKFQLEFNYSESDPNKRGTKRSDWTQNDAEVQFPLEVGKRYSVNEKWVNREGDPGDSAAKASVVAFEKIKTSAGEFDAYKIEIRGYWNNRSTRGGSGRFTRDVWWAPTVKRIVRWESKTHTGQNQLWDHQVRELIEYNAGQ